MVLTEYRTILFRSDNMCGIKPISKKYVFQIIFSCIANTLFANLLLYRTFVYLSRTFSKKKRWCRFSPTPQEMYYKKICIVKWIIPCSSCISSTTIIPKDCIIYTIAHISSNCDESSVCSSIKSFAMVYGEKSGAPYK